MKLPVVSGIVLLSMHGDNRTWGRIFIYAADGELQGGSRPFSPDEVSEIALWRNFILFLAHLGPKEKL